MAQISKSAASLRITGDDLIPGEITTLLGCEPDFSYAKGDEIIKNGHKRITSFGMWRVETIRREPENLNEQISEIFGKLSCNLEVWKYLSKKYHIDLFCGLFMNEDMEGMEIFPESLKILGDRGIILGLDIYGPD